MATDRQRISVRVMLAGMTLIATGRFAQPVPFDRAAGPEPDWMRLSGA